jgi:hypothetical protein
LKEFESLSLGWNNILSLIKKFKSSEYAFSRLLGRGSLSAGNIRNPFRTRRVTVKWVESVLYNIVFIPEFLFGVLENWVVYIATPILASYRDFLLHKLSSWKVLDPRVLDSIQVSWGIPSGLKPMIGQEIVQLRRLTLISLKSFLPKNFWPDYLKPGKEERIQILESPSPKFPFGKFKTSWGPSTRLFDSRNYIHFLTIWEKYLKNIFYAESKLWNEMVWGRRSDLSLDPNQIKLEYSPDYIRFKNDILTKMKYWKNDPVSLFLHSNPRLVWPNSIDHLFKYTSSEKKYARLVEDKDVSFYLAAFLKIFPMFKNRLDIKLISAPKPVAVPKVSKRFMADR